MSVVSYTNISLRRETYQEFKEMKSRMSDVSEPTNSDALDYLIEMYEKENE